MHVYILHFTGTETPTSSSDKILWQSSGSGAKVDPSTKLFEYLSLWGGWIFLLFMTRRSSVSIPSQSSWNCETDKYYFLQVFSWLDFISGEPLVYQVMLNCPPTLLILTSCSSVYQYVVIKTVCSNQSLMRYFSIFRWNISVAVFVPWGRRSILRRQSVVLMTQKSCASSRAIFGRSRW